MKNQIGDTNLEIDELESESFRLFSLEYTNLKKSDISMGSLSKEIEGFKESFEQRESSRLKRERGFIEDELEQLKISKEHIDVNVKHVEDEKESTEKGIERQTKDHQQEWDKLKERNLTLEKEIAELKLLLQKKESEKEVVEADLETVGEKIVNIKSKFKKQLEKIDKKRDKVMEEYNSHQQEFNAALARLQNVESQEVQLTECTNEYRGQQEYILQVKENIQKDVCKLDKQNKIKEKLNQEMITARNAYYEETQNLKDLMERIAERGTQLKTLDLEIEAAECEMAKIEEKIPVLEKEKKIAATARNFLEANKLAKEIKDRKDESDGIGLKRNELKDERERLIREIPEQDRLTLEMKDRITELKKCFDICSFRILEQRVADLQDMNDFFGATTYHSSITTDAIGKEVSHPV